MSQLSDRKATLKAVQDQKNLFDIYEKAFEHFDKHGSQKCARESHGFSAQQFLRYRLVCAQFWVLCVRYALKFFFTDLSLNALISFWLHSTLNRRKLGLQILPKSGLPRKLPPDIMVGSKDEAGHLAIDGKTVGA